MYERWVICLIIVAALAGCVGNKEPVVNKTMNLTPTPIPPHVIFPVQENATVYVEIFGSEFIPSKYNVTKGTTVRWTNMDSARYIITGKGFMSPALNKKESWSYTFNETGTFEYNLSDHPFMKPGRIIVELSPSINNS